MAGSAVPYNPHPLPQTPVSLSDKHSTGNDSDFSDDRWQRRSSQDSLQRTPPTSVGSSIPPSKRQEIVPTLQPPQLRLQGTPASPVSISPPRRDIQEPEVASILASEGESDHAKWSVRNVRTPDSVTTKSSAESLPIRSRPSSAQAKLPDGRKGPTHRRASSGPHDSIQEEGEGLHYHAFDDQLKERSSNNRISHVPTGSAGSSSSGGAGPDTRPPPSQQGGLQSQQLRVPRATLARPASTHTLNAEYRGRALSPFSAAGSDADSPRLFARDLSANRRSPSSRPVSYVDLLNNLPYSEQVAPTPPLNNRSLQGQVGRGASLLDTKKTLEMYRANVKKTQDPAVQYEFAVFMINAATDAQQGDGVDPAELHTEAKHILQRLSDRTYPFAQYYLGDGYFSGLFSKGKPDYDRAFPLFVSASKHGHAEASYRAALCYEFGWGTAKSYPKAVQFYRNSASKNHPGAATRLGLACIHGDMGLVGKGSAHYKDGVKWLKRASESADHQYNAGPYELGRMHLTGDDRDIFRDEVYAARLITQSAELGHAHANLLMGRAYETGEMSCPRDAALSVHFYNGAATRGLVEGMMALCAWYMLGAEPVLAKDESEAYEWARRAAETPAGVGGNGPVPDVKAMYAVGYFTEMGIGCRRDPLEANVWYVRAAELGYENARQRLEIIRVAAAGGVAGDGQGRKMGPVRMDKAEPRAKEMQSAHETTAADAEGGGLGSKKKFMGIF